MHNHASKEDRVEPREWAVKPSDQAPSQCKEQITSVVDLSCITIPSISQKRVTRLGLDDAGVFDCLPWELREGLALGRGSSLLGAETVLLGVGGVPDPVGEEIGGEEEDEEGSAERSTP